MKRKLLYLSLLLASVTFQLRLSAQNFSIPPIANFAYDPGIDTVWANSLYTFVNTSTNDSANYWKILPGLDNTKCGSGGLGCFTAIQSGATRNFSYTFMDTGTFEITLVVRNRSGIDSLKKMVYVGYPTRKPIANFFINKQTIGLSEWVPLYDLSQYGPTSYQWSISPLCNLNCTSPNDFVNASGQQAPNIKFPLLRGRDPGVFDICLKVTNAVGSDSVCKKKYVEVIGGTSACVGAQDTISTQVNGYVYDNGGPNQQYFTDIMGDCYFRIDPCASSVTLNIEQFKLRNVDSILFHDGGATGPIIRRLGGSNISAANRIITANSGVLFFRWKLGAGNSGPSDSGIVFRWTSVPATYPVPTAKFSCPDTVYSDYNIRFTNESTGQGNLSYAWDYNNGGTSIDYSQPNGANVTYSTSVVISRNVCLKVTNCKGTSQFCKRITVFPVATTPVAEFRAETNAGFTTDVFNLFDQTKNGPNQWRWSFVPNNVVYKNGTSQFSQNPQVTLTIPGVYTVQLNATNALGTDSIIKSMYITVLAYSSPNTEWPIAAGNDIGISRVTFAAVDTATGLKTPTYDPLYLRWTGLLYRGGEYDLNVYRLTSKDAMDRKVWIDFNMDADFNDPGELVISEIAGKTLIANTKIKIANNIEPGRQTRLRVGVSEANSTLTPDKATAGCFEDYGIEVGLDLTPPVVTLNDSSTMRMQVNTSFKDPGVTAIDNIEGDISVRAERITNLDTTKTGFYWAKYFVKDLYGNVSDTVYRTIQVEINTTGPTITLNGPDSVFIRVLEQTYVAPVPTAVDNLGNPINANRINQSGIVLSNKVGDYKVYFTVQDEFGFIDSAVQRVYVRDVVKPILRTYNDKPVIKHQVTSPYDDQLIIREDKYYPQDQLIFNRIGSVNFTVPGSYNLIYTLCDPSGNCAEPLYVQVDVQDTIPPSVTLLGENPANVSIFTTYNDPQVFYFDNYYANNSLVLNVSGNVNFQKIGAYQRKYTVKDGAGNKTEVVRLMNVIDNVAPMIEILGGTTVELAYNDTFVDPGVKLIDNYESDAKLRPRLVVTSNLEKATSGAWYGGERGWKEVKYNLIDSSGNKATEVKRRVYVDFRSGLNNSQLNTKQLVVYPNPNQGSFKLNLTENLKGNVKIVVYNTLGVEVYNEVSQTGIQSGHQVNLNQFSKGVYMLQLTNNGKVFTQKVTIQ